jgi:hypothetical protein
MMLLIIILVLFCLSFIFLMLLFITIKIKTLINFRWFSLYFIFLLNFFLFDPVKLVNICRLAYRVWLVVICLYLPAVSLTIIASGLRHTPIKVSTCTCFVILVHNGVLLNLALLYGFTIETETKEIIIRTSHNCLWLPLLLW